MNTKYQDIKNDTVSPLNFKFVAQEDITAYELTQLFPYIFGGKGLYKADLKGLEKRGLLRHLKVKPNRYK